APLGGLTAIPHALEGVRHRGHYGVETAEGAHMREVLPVRPLGLKADELPLVELEKKRDEELANGAPVVTPSGERAAGRRGVGRTILSLGERLQVLIDGLEPFGDRLGELGAPLLRIGGDVEVKIAVEP